MGSTAVGPSAGAVSDAHALTCIQGVRNDSAAVIPFGYPVQFNRDGISYLQTKYKAWELDFSLEMSGTITDTGQVVSLSYTLTGTLDNVNVDENAVRIAFLNAAPPRFTGTCTASFSHTIDGVPSNGSGPLGVRLEWMLEESVEGNPFDPYYYKTGGLWIPTCELFWSSIDTFFTRFGTLDTITPGATETVEIRTDGTILGSPITSNFAVATGLTVDSYDLDVNPTEFFEYRDSTGNNPVWHPTSGAELINHSVTTD